MKKVIPILLLLFLGGCDVFTLRDAEEPDKPPLWNSFYTTWQLALQNLEYGYEDERNLAKFSDLFMPGFRFYFAPQDVNDYNISTVWTRDSERDMLYNLHSMSGAITVTLEPIASQNDDLSSTPIKLYRTYTVTRDNAGTTFIYKGKAEIQMVQDNGFWRIINWYDYRSDPEPEQSLKPTWGKLKYDYAV
jgi:hypothetical protein